MPAVTFSATKVPVAAVRPCAGLKRATKAAPKVSNVAQSKEMMVWTPNDNKCAPRDALCLRTWAPRRRPAPLALWRATRPHHCQECLSRVSTPICAALGARTRAGNQRGGHSFKAARAPLRALSSASANARRCKPSTIIACKMMFGVAGAVTAALHDLGKLSERAPTMHLSISPRLRASMRRVLARQCSDRLDRALGRHCGRARGSCARHCSLAECPRSRSRSRRVQDVRDLLFPSPAQRPRDRQSSGLHYCQRLDALPRVRGHRLRVRAGQVASTLRQLRISGASRVACILSDCGCQCGRRVPFSY